MVKFSALQCLNYQECALDVLGVTCLLSYICICDRGCHVCRRGGALS